MTGFPSRAASFAALGTLASIASAQSPVPFPMDRAGIDPGTRLERLEPRDADVHGLLALDRVVFEGFVMPSGRVVELDVRRIDLDALELGYVVDGVALPGLPEGTDLSVWTGRVTGEPGSEVQLGFSQVGVRGWVRSQGELAHLMPQPGEGWRWDESYSLLVSERELASRGHALGDFCKADRIQEMWHPSSDAPPMLGAACGQLECKIAVETDYQLFTVFNDLVAEMAYVTALLAAVADRYQEQIGVLLTFPHVKFYTQNNDPWVTPDNGGSSISMLFEFQAKWGGNLPGDAQLAHFVSGASLGGGVAYLGVLCEPTEMFTFAVSGNIDSMTSFPVQQGPMNWDFIVFAHETGHNFNSPHTHDWCPTPIDNCSPFLDGACQTTQQCISNGTVMGYCHLCPGGFNNVTTYFQSPDVVNVMRQHAVACLPTTGVAEVLPLEQPTMLAPLMPTEVRTQVFGELVGPVELHYRFAPTDPFTIVPAMAARDEGPPGSTDQSDVGAGTFAATLPGAPCGALPEWFFAFTDVDCGFVQSPPFTAEVAIEVITYSDPLEDNAAGWSVDLDGNDNATQGIWERGDPIGTAAQPERDHSEPGTDCWFTGQTPAGGGSVDGDVDGGTTTLSTHYFDLTGKDATVSYWRWFSNDAAFGANEDVLEVDITNDAGQTWVNVETIGPTGPEVSGGWFQNKFRVKDVITPGPGMQLRFVASDKGRELGGRGGDRRLRDRRHRVHVLPARHRLRRPGAGDAVDLRGVAGDGLHGHPVADRRGAERADLVGAGDQREPDAPLRRHRRAGPANVVLTVATNGSGELSLPVPGGTGGFAVTLYVQALVFDLSQSDKFQISNALAAEFLP